MTAMTQFSLVLACLLAAACSIDVQRDDDARGSADVDIRTPVGDVLVKTEVVTDGIGLPVYPGATQLREQDEPQSASVNVGNGVFGVTVLAAKYESADAADSILTFYKRELARYGEVIECHGDIDFRDRGRRPVCDNDLGSRQVQLVAGVASSHRIVAVKPRGGRSELAMVFVEQR